MKLLIDLTGCDMRYFSVTVYAYRILQGLSKCGNKNIVILCNANIHNAIKNDFPLYQTYSIRMSRSFSPISVIASYFRWRRILSKIDYDVIYSPQPYPPFHCILKKGKTVTTFHDLQGLKVYSGIKLLISKIVYPLVLKRSDKIVAISNFVKNSIITTYPSIETSKITCIYNAVSSTIPSVKAAPIDCPYILYVSSFMRHKNVMTLLRAFYLVKDKIDHKLVLIGRENELWKEEVVPYIVKHGLQERIVAIHHSLEDDVLAQYYEYADLFVHPSYMEGFGYTPIEAAIHQVPVITTKEASLFETTLGLLNYYEPATDPTKLGNKILEVLHNRPQKDTLKDISDIFTNAYNGEKLAEELYNLCSN